MEATSFEGNVAVVVYDPFYLHTGYCRHDGIQKTMFLCLSEIGPWHCPIREQSVVMSSAISLCE